MINSSHAYMTGIELAAKCCHDDNAPAIPCIRFAQESYIGYRALHRRARVYSCWHQQDDR